MRSNNYRDQEKEKDRIIHEKMRSDPEFRAQERSADAAAKSDMRKDPDVYLVSSN